MRLNFTIVQNNMHESEQCMLSVNMHSEYAASKQADAACSQHYVRPCVCVCVCVYVPMLMACLACKTDQKLMRERERTFFILANLCLIPHCPLSSCHAHEQLSERTGSGQVNSDIGQLPSPS